MASYIVKPFFHLGIYFTNSIELLYYLPLPITINCLG